MRPKTRIRQNLLYNEATISELYQRNLACAKASLGTLEVFCGNDCKIGGLSGWVFEQTIQYCLQKELKVKGLQPIITEQCSLGGRAKADFAIGNFAIEIKLAGLFGMDQVEKYRRYREAANKRGLKYLFFSTAESCIPYRKGIIKALGAENVFFLDEPKDWRRFVNRIVAEIGHSRQRWPMMNR